MVSYSTNPGLSETLGGVFKTFAGDPNSKMKQAQLRAQAGKFNQDRLSSIQEMDIKRAEEASRLNLIQERQKGSKALSEVLGARQGAVEFGANNVLPQDFVGPSPSTTASPDDPNRGFDLYTLPEQKRDLGLVLGKYSHLKDFNTNAHKAVTTRMAVDGPDWRSMQSALNGGTGKSLNSIEVDEDVANSAATAAQSLQNIKPVNTNEKQITRVSKGHPLFTEQNGGVLMGSGATASGDNASSPLTEGPFEGTGETQQLQNVVYNVNNMVRGDKTQITPEAVGLYQQAYFKMYGPKRIMTDYVDRDTGEIGKQWVVQPGIAPPQGVISPAALSELIAESTPTVVSQDTNSVVSPVVGENPSAAVSQDANSVVSPVVGENPSATVSAAMSQDFPPPPVPDVQPVVGADGNPILASVAAPLPVEPASGLSEFEAKADDAHKLKMSMLPKNGDANKVVDTSEGDAQFIKVVTGTMSPKARTENQAKAYEYVGRMEIGEAGIQNSLENGGVPNIVEFYAAAPSQNMLGQLLGDAYAGDPAKAYMASVQVFLNAILRRDSGAAVPETEYPQYWAQFVPMPNSGPLELARKKEARRIAIEAMKSNARMSPSEILQMSKDTTKFKAEDAARLSPRQPTVAADPQLDAAMNRYREPR